MDAAQVANALDLEAALRVNILLDAPVYRLVVGVGRAAAGSFFIYKKKVFCFLGNFIKNEILGGPLPWAPSCGAIPLGSPWSPHGSRLLD